MLSGGGSFPALTLVWCCRFPGSRQHCGELLAVCAFGFVLFFGGYVSLNCFIIDPCQPPKCVDTNLNDQFLNKVRPIPECVLTHNEMLTDQKKVSCNSYRNVYTHAFKKVSQLCRIDLS